ncbi:uncharacterized protein LOC123526257 isoform X2 [Mercenaria mercenaria]|uniref:uncharacterized protein LOC123526257 isoform X2 n=1 Tax=Mercenaria mercenaria TaxID=6596 RepID=UPI00234EBA82|nr:uncharacterized protein LOC123526257 isoform X2 [Mercenaria mercenaria]
MDASRRVCISSFLILLLWCETGYCCKAERVRRGLKTMAAAQEPVVSTLQVNDFSTFRQHMAKTMGISETLLSSKKIEELYNKEIVEIDYTDPAQKSSITVLLLTALCSLCPNTDCDFCIRSCNKPCP